MKRKYMYVSIFISSIFLVFADQKTTNQKKIKELNSKISKNTEKQKLNKNTIQKVKNTEIQTLSEIKKIEANIQRLQSEYDEAEKIYREILKAIGQHDSQIQKTIDEINKNSEIISTTKTDITHKLMVYDKLTKNKKIDDVFSKEDVVAKEKKSHDLKVILDKQSQYITVVENKNKDVEKIKTKEEVDRAETEKEAQHVKEARIALENKNRALNSEKEKQNRLVAELRLTQQSLNSENAELTKTNKTLYSEKTRLEAQIRAIISREIEKNRREQLAINKAREEQKARQAAAAELKRNTTTTPVIANKPEERGTTDDLMDQDLIAQIKPVPPKSDPKPKPDIKPKPEPKLVDLPKGTGNFVMPVNGSIVIGYGQEKIAGSGVKSTGVEIRGVIGQSVRAADTGIVIFAGGLPNLGQVVIIDHGSLVTVYGNLSGTHVSKGATVTKGQSIGSLGRDSTTKEPNLYFETRKGVNLVNPMSYL